MYGVPAPDRPGTLGSDPARLPASCPVLRPVGDLVNPAPVLSAGTERLDLRPDLSLALTPSDLLIALRQYRICAGEPPFRQMALRAGRAVAPSTMCAVLNADTMPRLAVVLAIVIGCGGGEEDQRQFRAAWCRIKLDASGIKLPVARPPAEPLPGC